jgi:kynurenine formamidase
VPYVTPDRPVHGWELEEVVAAQGVELEPGDALVVHSGREAWTADNPLWPEPDWLRPEPVRPGLHASCLPFIRDHDVALVAWDLMDSTPTGYALPWTVHGVLYAYGVALVDNALLTPLAEACRQEGRYEFLFLIAPLRVVGGTGSPVNPLAMF